MTGIFRMTHSTLLLALLISGCTSTTQQPKTELDTFCENAYPIYLLGHEKLDDMNADKVVAMDKYGIKHCGWN